jgi:hypothetical protein
MSARDLNEAARLIDACDRHLAALRAAHPDGVPGGDKVAPAPHEAKRLVDAERAGS